MLLLFKTRIVSSFQLRYLQTLNSISAEHNSTVGDDKKKKAERLSSGYLPHPDRHYLKHDDKEEKWGGRWRGWKVCSRKCLYMSLYWNHHHHQVCLRKRWRICRVCPPRKVPRTSPACTSSPAPAASQGRTGMREYHDIMMREYCNMTRNILDIRCFECVQVFMMVKEQKGKIKLCWVKAGDRSISAPKALLGKPVNVFLTSINTTVHDVSEKTFNFRPNINYEKQNKQTTNCL